MRPAPSGSDARGSEIALPGRVDEEEGLGGRHRSLGVGRFHEKAMVLR